MNKKHLDCAAGVVNRKIIVVGGHNGTRRYPLACGEEYNPNTGEWSDIPPMHFKRSNCAAAVLDG